MDRGLLALYLVAVLSLVCHCAAGMSYAAGTGPADNGHTAKKSPMDYSRYAQDARQISGHNGLRGSQDSNLCDSRFQVKNSTIIRTKDSIRIGADFVMDKSVNSAVDCRRRCCQKEGNCDTAVFVEDKSKEKNCFLFKCWDEGILKCQFSSHWGYVTAIIGGFGDAPPTSRVSNADDSGRDELFHHGDDLQSDNVDSPDKLEEDRVDTTQCRRGQIQCASGECIVARYVCNGIDDCDDGSDEMGCNYGGWKHWSDEYSHHGDTNLPGVQDGYGDNDRDDDNVGYRPNDTKDGGDKHQDTGVDEQPEGFGEFEGNANDGKGSDVGGGTEEEEVVTEPKEPDDSPTVLPASTTRPQQPTVHVPVSEGFHKDEDQSPLDVTPKIDDNDDEPENYNEHKTVHPFGSEPATSAILPLAVGLIITLLLLMMLSCRLRYMNRRLRYGRLKTHAHDADYLINGMYL